MHFWIGTLLLSMRGTPSENWKTNWIFKSQLFQQWVKLSQILLIESDSIIFPLQLEWLGVDKNEEECL
jgi:hypothetical protein